MDASITSVSAPIVSQDPPHSTTRATLRLVRGLELALALAQEGGLEAGALAGQAHPTTLLAEGRGCHPGPTSGGPLS